MSEKRFPRNTYPFEALEVHWECKFTHMCMHRYGCVCICMCQETTRHTPHTDTYIHKKVEGNLPKLATKSAAFQAVLQSRRSSGIELSQIQST